MEPRPSAGVPAESGRGFIEPRACRLDPRAADAYPRNVEKDGSVWLVRSLPDGSPVWRHAPSPTTPALTHVASVNSWGVDHATADICHHSRHRRSSPVAPLLCRRLRLGAGIREC